jgi:plasmid stability protein
MPSITLKKIPARLHDQLKLRAKQNRRSLNSEVIALLEQSVEPKQVDVTELLEKARRFRSILTFEATDEEISEAKRQGRL